MPSITALNWQADALVDLDETETETDDPDWDDVAILIGSEIVRDVRAAVRATLKYTCVSQPLYSFDNHTPLSHYTPVHCANRLTLQSAGIALNKMLAKLGSGSKKPNGQTVVRNRAITHFLSGFKFTKIRNLGGKLGDQIVQTFGTESVSELLLVPIEQLKLKLGDDTGVWVFNTIRGVDQSEVNARIQIKSMLSAKSFRPSVNSVEQAIKWLRIFVGDIFSRLVEEGVLENKRRPRTINLHHRHGGQTKSRQSPIPQGKPIDKEMLFELAKHLLNQIVLEGKVWPCANLSLSVGGFDEGITGNMGIGAFLVKGEAAQALKRDSREDSSEALSDRPLEKQRKTDKKPNIQQFFSKQAEKSQEEKASSKTANRASESSRMSQKHTEEFISEGHPASSAGLGAGYQLGGETHLLDPATDYACDRCRTNFRDAEQLQYHQDEHLARDLQEEERGSRAFVGHRPAASLLSTSVATRPSAAAPRRPTNKKTKTEAGQSKLNFG